MIAEELAKGDVIRSGVTVVGTVGHDRHVSVIVRHANGVVRIQDYDRGYNVPVVLPEGVSSVLDSLARVLLDLPPTARRGYDASLDVDPPDPDDD